MGIGQYWKRISENLTRRTVDCFGLRVKSVHVTLARFVSYSTLSTFQKKRSSSLNSELSCIKFFALVLIAIYEILKLNLYLLLSWVVKRIATERKKTPALPRRKRSCSKISAEMFLQNHPLCFTETRSSCP